MSKLLIAMWLLPALAGELGAQEFVPPDRRDGGDESSDRESFESPFGIFSFTARVGYDFTDRNEGVVGVGLDVGQLLNERVRIRPLAEFGFGSDLNSVVLGSDLIFRLTPDSVPAVPYVGMGLAIFGSQGCDTDPDCPELWGQFVLGFDLDFSDHFNAVIEYRGEDLLRQHRIFIGFVSRRSN